MKEKVAAIVLAAGYGKRMKSGIAKQYMLIKGKPILYYSLKSFEDSSIDEIILVAGKGEAELRKTEYIEKYGISKIKKVVEGGMERCHSVYEGLKAVKDADYVLIHDGARPLVSIELIERTIQCVKKEKACITGMPSKDTIKISDNSGYVDSTIDRQSAWVIQTPQAFAYNIIMEAYQKVMDVSECVITDDAMAVEFASGCKIFLLEGSYKNIKVTTPEDLCTAEALLEERYMP